MSNNKSKHLAPHWYITGTFILIVAFLILKASRIDMMEETVNTVPFIASTPILPDTIDFCFERVPVEYFDVKESLERELTVNMYWHSQTIWLIQRANRYFPEIEPILQQNNIPDDFKYLAIAESGLQNVVSPAGATGFWQLLEGTAKDYGLEINEEVDERYHIEKSTVAACKYFQESFDRYQSWTLAAASYNVGRRGVDRQIEKQKENNYYDLLFNEETARYVYRALAFKLVFENPEKYGFIMPVEKRYQVIPYKEIDIDVPVESWADFAHEHNTNYKLIKFLNPWLRVEKLSNKTGKTYTIRIPKRNARETK
ncbi:MAG: lytic transglycosylase domain-containing protein [Bacteroidales bacterium]|nr:lytic transglycosylase domain-containing protein [Bacteroidales bacterium]MBN2818094.1 lytic transglycosylase domain-containing protein [Bacteroidales bacterium]